MPKAKAAAMKALQVDDSLAEAHASLAFVQLYYEWDWAGAEKSFQRAIELNPNYAPARQWYPHLLMSRGRTSDAISEATRAAEIDPLSLPALMNLGWQYHWLRQYDLAIERLQKVLEIDPNFEQAHWGLGLALEGKKSVKEAAAEFQRATDLSGGNPVYLAALGRAYAIGGKRADALEVRSQLENNRATSRVTGWRRFRPRSATGLKLSSGWRRLMRNAPADSSGLGSTLEWTACTQIRVSPASSAASGCRMHGRPTHRRRG